MKYKMLIVDDELANLRLLERLFRADYEVITTSSGAAALELLSLYDVAVIISDQRMPGMTGIEFLKRAAELRHQTVRMILTGFTDASDLVDAINSGVIYKYITKPWTNSDLKQTVQRAIEHYELTKKQHGLMLDNERLEVRLKSTVRGFVNVACEMAAQREPDAVEHSRRTSGYASLVAQHYGLKEDMTRQLILAALLHEAVHLNIPSVEYLKSGSFTAEQHRAIKVSYENGLRLIAGVPDLEYATTIIKYQHEHFDGTGLFDGLDGEKIPFCSRILAVANAYDEITSGMHPQHLCTAEEARDWLRSRAGTEFDPAIVEDFLKFELGEDLSVTEGKVETDSAANLIVPDGGLQHGHAKMDVELTN